MDTTNCVWTIKNKTAVGFQGEPLGMVIANVDDLIAVGQQEQLDGMKASLDACLCLEGVGVPSPAHAKTSGSFGVPSPAHAKTRKAKTGNFQQVRNVGA